MKGLLGFLYIFPKIVYFSYYAIFYHPIKFSNSHYYASLLHFSPCPIPTRPQEFLELQNDILFIIETNAWHVVGVP